MPFYLFEMKTAERHDWQVESHAALSERTYIFSQLSCEPELIKKVVIRPLGLMEPVYVWVKEIFLQLF